MVTRRGLVQVTELSGYECAPEHPIRLALTRLNASDHLFQLIVDRDGRLLGTVTDGDVRRALLRGVSLDDPVRDCMHTAYIAGHSGDDARNRELASGMKFLPILDDGGHVQEVLAPGSRPSCIETALVMAGGFGTRLGERTRKTPKPLLPVGGRPILDHVLGNLESAGVRQIFVSVNYLADQIVAFLAQRPGHAETVPLHENRRLGTAGAIQLLPPEVKAQPILVVNGDLVTRVDIGAICDFQQSHSVDATVAVTSHHVDIPFGVVRCDADGLFTGIEEKPRITQFVAAGVYCLTPPVTGLVGTGKPIDMPEVLNRAREIGLKIGLFPIHEYWIDVGRPDDLDAANNDYKKN